LRTRLYGRTTGLAIDPVEKKPLYHFYPGSPVLSLGTVGCNLSCSFCQNWQISQVKSIERAGVLLSPEQLVEIAKQHHCSCVAFTYNEPVIWAEFVIDASRCCHQAGLKTVAVSNGMINPVARSEFFQDIDAVNIDLKGFTSDFYQEMTRGSLEAVQETLSWLVHESSVWLEITTLLIPGKNDDTEQLTRMCDWIAQDLGVDIPLHFSAFFPTWHLTDVPETPLSSLKNAKAIALNSGIHYVYLGNVSCEHESDTICPGCGKSLICRDYRRVDSCFLLVPDKKNDKLPDYDGFCSFCGYGISGKF